MKEWRLGLRPASVAQAPKISRMVTCQVFRLFLSSNVMPMSFNLIAITPKGSEGYSPIAGGARLPRLCTWPQSASTTLNYYKLQLMVLSTKRQNPLFTKFR